MQSLTDYPDHWLERAENADRLAKEMDDPKAKRGMQDVASSYRRIAQRSAWRGNSAPAECISPERAQISRFLVQEAEARVNHSTRPCLWSTGTATLPEEEGPTKNSPK